MRPIREGSREYVSGPYATWEVNPRVKGKAQFAKDYEEDPVMAQTMYECRPVRAVNPYFRNETAVRSVVREVNPVTADYRLEDVGVPTGDGQAQVWVPEYTFDPGLVPMQGAEYVIHADLAIKADRAGVAMSHVKAWREVTDTRLAADGDVEEVIESRPEVWLISRSGTRPICVRLQRGRSRSGGSGRWWPISSAGGFR